MTAAARRSGGAQRYLKSQGGGAWEGRRQGMQGPSVVGQTDAGLHAAPAPPAEGVAGLARHGGPSDFAHRALRGSHYKDHTGAIASNNSRPVWPRPPLPTRGCLLKAPELLHPTQIPTRADAAPKLVIDHEHRNHRTSLGRALRGSHCKDQAVSPLSNNSRRSKKKHGKVREDRRNHGEDESATEARKQVANGSETNQCEAEIEWR